MALLLDSKRFHDGVWVDQSHLGNLFLDLCVIINFFIVSAAPIVINVHVHVTRVHSTAFQEQVLDLDLSSDLIQEALQQREVHHTVLIELLVIRPVCDSGPDYSLEQVIGVDAPQVVVDTLYDFLLLTSSQCHHSIFLQTNIALHNYRPARVI